jgi:hypothetical protein
MGEDRCTLDRFLHETEDGRMCDLAAAGGGLDLLVGPATGSGG